jgi:hypothetical protein
MAPYTNAMPLVLLYMPLLTVRKFFRQSTKKPFPLS